MVKINIMITTQFKIKDILLAVSMCFDKLSPRFQVHLLDAYKNDNNFEALAEISVDSQDLIIIYRSMSRMPEGVVGSTNKRLKEIILPLILEKANNNVSEAIELLRELQNIDMENEGEKGRMINYMAIVFDKFS